MDAATQCYIAERIPNPMYGYPRWVTSALVAGVDEVDIDFGNKFQGVYISKLLPAPVLGITGNILNANGQVLINIPLAANTQSFFLPSITLKPIASPFFINSGMLFQSII